MKSRFVCMIVVALAALTADVSWSASGDGGPPGAQATGKTVSLAVGESVALKVPDLVRVVIPPRSVVDVKVASEKNGVTTLMVVGFDTGKTEVQFVTKTHVRIHTFRISGKSRGLGPLRELISKPPFKGHVFLEAGDGNLPRLAGDLDDLDAYRRLHRLAVAHQVEFTVLIAPQAYGPLAELVRKRLAKEGLECLEVKALPIFPPIRVTGRVETKAMRERAEAIVRECCDELARVGIDARLQQPSPAAIRKILQQLPPGERDKVYNRKKNDPDVLVLYGDHHFLMCGGTQVGAAYRKALAMEPEHLRANLGMGEWLSTHGRYREALPYLEKAIEIAPVDSVERSHAKAVLRYVEQQLEREDRSNPE